MNDPRDKLKQKMWTTGFPLQGKGVPGPVVLQVCCAPWGCVRAGHSSPIAALDLISEVSCGNYRQRE